MKPKIFITRSVPEEALNILKKHFIIDMWDEADVAVPLNILEEKIVEVDGIFCLLTEKLDEKILSKAKNLKIISNMAVGYDNIDLDYACKKGIMVTNTPGILTETTADLTFALLLATSRRMIEASNYLKNGQWKTSWSPMLLTGQDVYEATIGIVGLGRIGESVARRAKGFNMDILYYNRSRKKDVEKELGAKKVDLQTLLKEADFVCVLIPFTSETHNLIGENELNLMKRNAILINTSRGGIVDEKALYFALKEKKLYAAGLDVFEKEPVSMDNPLLTLENLVSLPHIGSASNKTRLEMATIAAQNLVDGLIYKSPNNLVNTPY